MRITFCQAGKPDQVFEGITDTPNKQQLADAPIVAIMIVDGEPDLWYAESLEVAKREIPRVYREIHGFAVREAHYYARIVGA